MKLISLSVIAGILLSTAVSTAMACGCTEKKADKSPMKHNTVSKPKVESAKPLDND